MADDKQRGGGFSDQPEDDFGDFLSDGAEPNAKPGSDFGALTGGGTDDDAGLGNLPPLSDFESEAPAKGKGGESGGFDSGLPPLDQIKPETPRPTGGNIRPAPPGFEDHSAFDTPISDSGLDTPHTPSGLDTPRTPGSGTSFQDLTADSDFSPETPEIGPGPDSDLETPMFDSAFGGGGAFDRTPDTSAPTQAMETPIFGDHGGPSGFDPDAFSAGAGAGALGGGTPIPDFSPDTGIPGRVAPPPSGMDVSGTGAGPAHSGGGMGVGALLGAALVALLLGAGLGSWFLADKLPFTPAATTLAERDTEITRLRGSVSSLQTQVDQLKKTQVLTGGEQVDISPQRVEELTTQIADLTQRQQEAAKELVVRQAELQAVLGDLEAKTQEYAEAENDYQQLMNQVSIERARSDGLQAELTRLQDQVGTMEQAAARSTELRNRLLSEINRLEVVIQDGIALTPAKYSHEDRLAAVRELKEQVANSQVVTPELMDQFTRLVEQEMQIGQAREYFFAKIPVRDRFGTVRQKWAEAVMNGNWSVYFRTLDGEVGIYERVAGSTPPEYRFRQFLPAPVAKQVEEEVLAARTPGWEQQVATLAQREVTMESSTGVQRVFDSL